MRLGHRRIMGLVLAAALGLTACQGAGAGEGGGGEHPATIQPIEGSEVARITLSEDAARRLGIQTAPVERLRGDGGSRTAIPYAAVLYDPSGHTWAYTTPEPLVFVREPIRVHRIDGNRAILSDSPPPGTEVVIVGASELLGVEYEVGEE
ncbi:MAG: hypothetical protein ACE14W_04830 [Candidatus Velamenicoccus archaeovorus]